MAKKNRFLQILASHVAAGKSVRDAANLAGCSESTAYRLCRTAEFRSEVANIRTSAIDGAIGELSSATTLAVRRLVQLLDDPASALGAAKAILANVKPLAEHGEFRQRLDALEGKS